MFPNGVPNLMELRHEVPPMARPEGQLNSTQEEIDQYSKKCRRGMNLSYCVLSYNEVCIY